MSSAFVVLSFFLEHLAPIIGGPCIYDHPLSDDDDSDADESDNGIAEDEVIPPRAENWPILSEFDTVLYMRSAISHNRLNVVQYFVEKHSFQVMSFYVEFAVQEIRPEIASYLASKLKELTGKSVSLEVQQPRMFDATSYSRISLSYEWTIS